MKYSCKEDFEKENIFGTGLPNDAYARYFVGRSFLNPLTGPETGVLLSNVTFEPGCRNNWHIHHAKAAAGSFCSARPEKAGIKRRENRRSALFPERSCLPGQCEALAWALKRIPGSVISPWRFPARGFLPSGWSR